MDDGNNYTPISLNGAHPKSFFLSARSRRTFFAIAGTLVMGVMVGVATIALRNNQSITTPAQIVVGPLCPAGSKQISVDATNVDGMSSMCPGGEIIIVEGTNPLSSAVNPATAGGVSSDSGDSSTTLPGASTGDGDTGTTSTRIVCCRPSTTSPTVTPPSSDTPITPPVDTPEACVLPKFQIQSVSMTVVNCSNCDE